MMHIHIDLLGGLAGDMFLAAAIDAEIIDVEMLQTALRTLGLGERLRIVPQKVMRGAIKGTHVRFENWDPAADADHRHLTEILRMIDLSALSEAVKARAKDMFNILGRAESEIHGVSLEKVHFHEVGAVDSILDFVSAAWIIEHANASWSISNVPVGSGTIETDHGTIPVPAPATALLLKDFPLVYRGIESEFVTPTGAAILRTLKPYFAKAEGILQTTGYGAGTRDLQTISNVVRFVVLDEQSEKTSKNEAFDEDSVYQIATEIDDMNPEIIAYTEQQLFEQGALDVVREPVLMKKGRQGIRLTVLCEESVRDQVVATIFQETSTFGVRINTIARYKMPRHIKSVDTPYGTVHIKIGLQHDVAVKVAPEYEDCAALAREHRVSLREVYDSAYQAAKAKFLS